MRTHLLNIYHYISPIILRQLSWSALGVWIPVIIFASLADEVTERDPLPFDVPILQFMHSIASPGLDTGVLIVTNLGGMLSVGLATFILVLICYRWISRRAAYAVALIAGGAAIMNLALKTIFQRARPDLWQAIVTEKSFSFPSGHAMASSALAFCAMAVFWDTRWRWPVVAVGTTFLLAVGLSRVYLGVHFPSDVLAGWCASFIWALLVRRVLWHHRLPR